MKEQTIVRENLMTQDGYTPYCGNNLPSAVKGGCNNPRTVWNGEQFKCPTCGFTSEFPADFIARYKERWSKQPTDQEKAMQKINDHFKEIRENINNYIQKFNIKKS